MYLNTIVHVNSRKGWHTRLEWAALVGGMVVGAVNVWTGVPLLGLWVGSRFVSTNGISMLAVLMIVLTMASATWIVLRVLAVLDARLRHLTGRDLTVSRHLPWLRSMRGERPHDAETGLGLGPLDYVMVTVVVVAVIAFEIWFMFLSGSPLDQRSGR